MADTKIEWSDSVWNPIRGCDKVSPGCKNCYAETFAERWRGVQGHPYEQGFDLRLVPEKLAEPLSWKKPRRVFVNSMSDLFHEDVPNEYIAAVFGVMAAAPRHTFQVLTKRSKRMREWFEWLPSNYEPIVERRDFEVRLCLCHLDHYIRRDFHVAYPQWPLPNVWLGVSAEDQERADERIPDLLATPAAVRFVSAEPLLGSIDLRRWLDRAHLEPDPVRPIDWIRSDLHWVIVGGESGPGARPFDLRAAHRIVTDCREAGVAVFFKQQGAKTFTSSCAGGLSCTHPDCDKTIVRFTKKRSSDPALMPEWARVREWPRP